MSGFGDAEKLRAARELASSFSKTKDFPKKGGGGGGIGPRQARWEPHYPPITQQRYGQITPSPASQRYGQVTASATSSRSSVPPPSQRNYSSTPSFSTGRTKKSVIGSSGLDFLKASGTKPGELEKPQQSPVHITNPASNATAQAEIGSNAIATDETSLSTPPETPEHAPRGNILDAFLSIMAKKPSIGQEIDTLASILPKAMDLNAPATATSNARPTTDHQNGDVKTNSAGNTPQRSGARSSQQGGLDAPPSAKPSPVAAAVVSTNGTAQRQSAGTHGSSKVSATKENGLSSSAWA